MQPRQHGAPAQRRAVLALATLCAAGLVPGCGFKLRQPPKLNFPSIALQGFAPKSRLADALRRQLSLQVKVVDDPTQAAVVLQALEDRSDRSVVATTAAAQVRDLQLRVALRFRAYTPTGRELVARTELLAKRELSYSETAALGKEAEEAELLRDMHADVVAQVLRLLAAVVV